MEIANIPLDRSAPIVLSILNALQLHRSSPNPARNFARAGVKDLAGFSKNGRIPDLLKPEPKSTTTFFLNHYLYGISIQVD